MSDQTTEYLEMARWAARKWSALAWRDDAEQEALLKLLKHPPDPERAEGERRAYMRRVVRSAVFSFNAKRWRREKREKLASERVDGEVVGLPDVGHEATPEAHIVARELDSAIRRAFREAMTEMSPGEAAYIRHAFGLPQEGDAKPLKPYGVKARQKIVRAAQRHGVELDRRLLYSGGVNPSVWGEYLNA